MYKHYTDSRNTGRIASSYQPAIIALAHGLLFLHKILTYQRGVFMRDVAIIHVYQVCDGTPLLCTFLLNNYRAISMKS